MIEDPLESAQNNIPNIPACITGWNVTVHAVLHYAFLSASIASSI